MFDDGYIKNILRTRTPISNLNLQFESRFAYQSWLEHEKKVKIYCFIKTKLTRTNFRYMLLIVLEILQYFHKHIMESTAAKTREKFRVLLTKHEMSVKSHKI